MEPNELTIDEPNRWRLETPGCAGWEHTARPGDPNKYLMISVDCHANEPRGFLAERLDKKFRERMPRVVVDEKGVKFTVTDSGDKSRLLMNRELEGEDRIRAKSGYTPEDRLRDHAQDGVEAEIIFPNKGLLVWATQDGEFATAEELVKGTFTGRNFGWLPSEQAQARRHFARVIREDDGTGSPAGTTAHLSYAVLMRGVDANIPPALRLPESFRLDPARASNEEILDGCARLVVAFLQSLQCAARCAGERSIGIVRGGSEGLRGAR